MSSKQVCATWHDLRALAVQYLTFSIFLLPVHTHPQVVEQRTQFGEMTQWERTVLFDHPPTIPSITATNHQKLEAIGQRLSTDVSSRATVRFDDGTLIRMIESTRLEIVPRTNAGRGVATRILQGGAYFAGYRTVDEIAILTPQGVIAPLGTEFAIEVMDGQTRLIMLDGSARLTNSMGSATVQVGEWGMMEAGQAPRIARLEARNIVQWWLYYPAVLNPAEINLPATEREDFKVSMEAYRAGRLPAALEALPDYPRARRQASVEAILFQSQLFLASGSVREAVSLLDLVEGEPPLKRALDQLISAVQMDWAHESREPRTTSEWLAQSYQFQARRDLRQALEAARQAVSQSSDFAFAHVRVAELEFGFGRNDKAESALRQALELAPGNAQAKALQGFLLAGRNQRKESARAFAEAIRLDSSLGNAWLGQGLLKLRRGEWTEGLEDLKTAAILEPNRSLLRSYLGKAFQQAGREIPALKELDYAKRLDELDPTPWLYSALLNHQQNRVNQGIDDLERSARLNDNRAVYRSRLLLDQDASVRSVNLAHLYEDAGLDQVGVREAARGVNESHANFSGHLFLANSYNQLLDPGRVGLRYETAASTEYLIANLLAPVGAGVLSSTLSQQEYSSLFQEDGVGLVSSTEYLSRGAWRQQGAAYGTFGRTSASFEALYLRDNGQHANNDLELTGYSARLKHQVSAKGDLFGQVLWSDGETGDRLPRYDPTAAFTNGGPNSLVRVEEQQEPIVLGGYHHAWSPGQHSLLLTGYAHDELVVMNPQQPVLNVLSALNQASILPFDQHYRSELKLGLVEAQHIVRREPHALIFGGRYQGGTLDVNSRAQTDAFGPGFPFTGSDEDFDLNLERASVYAYYQFEFTPNLSIQAGGSYDWLTYPSNFRYAPLSEDEETSSQWSPKAGLVWKPTAKTSLSAGYARFLTGVSLEQSLRLEPTQVAGINQAFRSVIPDTLTGANSAEEANVAGVLVDHQFPTRTYVGLTANWLWSETDRDEGFYSISGLQGTVQSFRRELDYEEQSIGVGLNQLFLDYWSLGGHYQLSRAELDTSIHGLPANLTTDLGDPFPTRQDLTGWLHQVRFSIAFNHPTGFFARGDSVWYQQSNQGYEPDRPGDDFWHFNAFAGWRLFQRRVAVTIGVLNLTDQDYRLDPINFYPDLPRERTFYTRFRIHL